MGASVISRSACCPSVFADLARAADPEVVLVNSVQSLAPAQQPTVTVRLAKRYPSSLSGELRLDFAPNADNPADDLSVVFSNGSRVVGFRIAARDTEAVFTGGSSSIGYQTGTVAGRLTITATLRADGDDVTPSPAPSLILTLARSAPVITRLSVNARPPSGFDLVVVGYSTPRSLRRVSFDFQARSGSSLQTPSASVDLGALSASWFQDSGSRKFGSQFRLVVPFTVQGELSTLSATSATLSNVEGNSVIRTAQFP